VGSGGLSHDPPLPSLSNATPEVKARLTNGSGLTHAERVSRQHRTFKASYSRPDTTLRPLNPDWDRKFLDAVVRGDLNVFDGVDDDVITNTAGSGAHELRTWIAALAAARAGGTTAVKLVFYEPILEWITGMGVVTASAVTQSQ
jgi:2,3-dihydroxyphenylpropionate 1,2-dioxygenase